MTPRVQAAGNIKIQAHALLLAVVDEVDHAHGASLDIPTARLAINIYEAMTNILNKVTP